MSLKGNLENFFFASILQLLYLEKKTGVLRVKHGNKEAKVFFDEGTIISASESRETIRLGNLLKTEGLLSDNQLRNFLAVAKEQGKTIGTVLIEKKIITSERLREINGKLVEDTLYDLFLWEHGDFEYLDGLPKLEGRAITENRTMDLILEASRRVDEMSILAKQIPSERTIMKMSRHISDNKEITLNTHEWRILSLINGTRSVREIIKESGDDEFSVYKTLYALITSGLIESSGEAPLRKIIDRPEQDTRQPADDKKTILVADDMTQIRKILRFSLREVGYNVILAEDGEQALAHVFGDNPPDLVILDIMMPKIDGYQVIKKIRESESTMHIPVIILTAKSQREDVLQGMKSGANDYMVKPYKFVDLHKKIEELLGQLPR